MLLKYRRDLDRRAESTAFRTQEFMLRGVSASQLAATHTVCHSSVSAGAVTHLAPSSSKNSIPPPKSQVNQDNNPRLPTLLPGPSQPASVSPRSLLPSTRIPTVGFLGCLLPCFPSTCSPSASGPCPLGTPVLLPRHQAAGR